MTDSDIDAAAWQREPDTKPERLLSLTLALLSNPVGLTKDELFRGVRGYSTAIEDGVKPDALNKMFERDKQALREMGVQVETFIRDADMDDNTESRYFIPADTFVWPKGTSLTPNQLRLLELAAKVWARASFSVEASRAVMRLKALGMPSEGLELAGFAPRLLTNEPGILQLEEAARDRQVVTFDYRAPGREIERRVVHPWQVRHVSGQWLLVCFDAERGEVRNFMLKRIVSRIKPTGETFAAITPEQLEGALSSLKQFIDQNVAVISVQPGTAAWVHFEMDTRSSGSGQNYEFNFMDVHLLAEQLRVFGTTVTVHAPQQLRDAIRAGLEKVASAHA